MGIRLVPFKQPLRGHWNLGWSQWRGPVGRAGHAFRAPMAFIRTNPHSGAKAGKKAQITT